MSDNLHFTEEGYRVFAKQVGLPEPSQAGGKRYAMGSLDVDQMCEAMKELAIEINSHSGDGALHVFIADGNCEFETLEFCLEQPNITDREREFCERIMQECVEEAVFGAWALAKIARPDHEADGG